MNERKAIRIQTHQKLQNRPRGCVFYELKSSMCWPGMKAPIENVIKECETCQDNSRKRKDLPKYAKTSKLFERVAIDMMYLSEIKNTCCLTKIVYEVFSSKSSRLTRLEKLNKGYEKWFSERCMPETLISDNEKEFTNR